MSVCTHLYMHACLNMCVRVLRPGSPRGQIQEQSRFPEGIGPEQLVDPYNPPRGSIMSGSPISLDTLCGKPPGQAPPHGSCNIQLCCSNRSFGMEVALREA